MQARFDEAIRLAEGAFLDELSKLVEHLTERLTGTDDGKPKVFRDSAVENLTGFFERFRHLNVRSNQQLDELKLLRRLNQMYTSQDKRNPQVFAFCGLESSPHLLPQPNKSLEFPQKSIVYAWFCRLSSYPGAHAKEPPASVRDGGSG